jgi:hypothetical protein
MTDGTPATPAQVVERLFWTSVAAGLASITGAALMNVDIAALQVAGFAALGGLFNGVLQFARYRLSVLPNPGDGLPGGLLQ